MERTILKKNETSISDYTRKSLKTPFIIFTVVVILSLAQIFWWIFYQVHQNRILFQLHSTVISIQTQKALDEVNRTYENIIIAHTLQTQHENTDEMSQKDIPEILRQGNEGLFYCKAEKVYYKDFRGRVIGSNIDWNKLEKWFDQKYAELTIERLPQTQGKLYVYGPERLLKLPVMVRPKTDFLETLTTQADRKAWMFISEGAFLSLMVLMGIYWMYVVLKKELAMQAQQKNFLLSITHELKSPLASIKLYVETLLFKKNVPVDKQQQFLNHSLHDVERLGRLVENVLEAARLEQDDYLYVMKATEISDLVNRCLHRVRYYAEDETVDLKVDLSKPVMVDGDEHALISIFDNLIENAVKYSQTPKEISIRLYAKEQKAIFEIQDNGIGIDPKDRPFIFERFYRAGNEMTRNNKGTGIGLYVVKKIVEKHGGNIYVHSDGVHKGSTFIVQFPLKSVGEI